MAIVSSTAIGNAVKTAGELTYRRSKGRTIASRRIVSNKSNTAPQKSQRSAFGVLTKSAKSISAWIDANFTATKYGTPRNAFIKQNAPALNFIRENSASIDGDGVMGLVDALGLGATVYAANGNRPVNIEASLSDKHELSITLEYAGEMAEGDIVSICLLKKIKSVSAIGEFLHSKVENYAYTLNIADFTNPGVVVIDKTKIAALGTCCNLVGNIESIAVAAAATVNTDGEKCSTLFQYVGIAQTGGEEERPGEL